MPFSNNPTNPTFHQRKQQRKQQYETYEKGWRLQTCAACNGSGYYDSYNSPPCAACNGSGKERYLPRYQHTKTPIDTILNQPYTLMIHPTLDLRIRVRNRREVIYQYIGIDNQNKQPRIRTRLRVGYDTVNHVDDWYFEDLNGTTYYLHEFIKTNTQN